jgi:orotidine-5'-phosphate decarboxylase
MMHRTMQDVRSVCELEGTSRPFVIGVTVLTSSTMTRSGRSALETSAEQQVVRLAKLTAESGFGWRRRVTLETAAVRNAVDRGRFLVVTPA